MNDFSAICDGCSECAMRCTDGIKISEFEFQRIVEELRDMAPAYIFKVLQQDKEREWFEDVTYTACLFLDIETMRCLVYAARPLICRLFGRVKHLPCPIARVPADLDARRILQAYASQPLATFQQWMMRGEFFNFNDLLGIPYEPPRIEI